MLEASGRKKECWEEIEDMKAKFSLSESVELGLKILSPEHVRKLLGSSIQWRLAEVADKDKLVRSIIAKFDPKVDELVHKLEDKESDISPGSRSRQPPHSPQMQSIDGVNSIPLGSRRHRSRSRGYRDRGADKDDWGRGGQQNYSQQPDKPQQQRGWANDTSQQQKGQAAQEQQRSWSNGASQQQRGQSAQASVTASMAQQSAVPSGPGFASSALVPKAGIAVAAPAAAAAATAVARGVPQMSTPLRGPNPGLRAPASALNALRPAVATQMSTARAGPVVPGLAPPRPASSQAGILAARRPAGAAGSCFAQVPARPAAAQPQPAAATGKNLELMRALGAANLSAFLAPLAQLGVELLADLAYVTDADLKAMHMTIIQQRKFRELMSQAR